MKKIVVLFAVFIITLLPANADIVKISATDAVHLALSNNLELQAKRKEIGILEQEIKMANALKNPQLQSTKPELLCLLKFLNVEFVKKLQLQI